jgi:hypothetical protein
MEGRMSAISLDWDEDALRIQGLYAPDAVTLQAPNLAPSGLSAASSIARAENIPLPSRQRPQLEPPRHYMLDLLDMHRTVEDTVAKELTLFKEQSNLDLAEIDRLEKEKDEALRQHAEEAASRASWSVLANVAQYLAAGTSIAVGASLGSWGTLLVASGISGLGYRLVRDTVGWQSVAGWFSKSVENQKKLVQRIEMGFLAVELGTGLAGGVGSCLTGGFSTLANGPRLDVARKAVATMQTTSTYMTGVSRLSRNFIEKRVSDLQARMRELDANGEKIRMEMNQQATSARDMIDMALSIGKEMHKAVAASEIQDL